MQSVQAILDGKHDETKHVAEKMSEEEVEQVKDAITDAQDFVRQNMEADPDEYNEAKSEAEKATPRQMAANEVQEIIVFS